MVSLILKISSVSDSVAGGSPGHLWAQNEPVLLAGWPVAVARSALIHPKAGVWAHGAARGATRCVSSFSHTPWTL